MSNAVLAELPLAQQYLASAIVYLMVPRPLFTCFQKAQYLEHLTPHLSLCHGMCCLVSRKTRRCATHCWTTPEVMFDKMRKDPEALDINYERFLEAFIKSERQDQQISMMFCKIHLESLGIGLREIKSEVPGPNLACRVYTCAWIHCRFHYLPHMTQTCLSGLVCHLGARCPSSSRWALRSGCRAWQDQSPAHKGQGA